MQDGSTRWLYDVGNGDAPISGLNGSYHVVLSHFHADHIGNIGRIRAGELYVSRETDRHLPREIRSARRIHVVTEPIRIGGLHIFPLPSSHAKGCLGLEVDGTYAFVGDALYCRAKKDGFAYNAQLLKEEIAVLNSLRAPWLLVSHFGGFLRRKEEVLAELKEIYARRTKDSAEIPVR